MKIRQFFNPLFIICTALFIVRQFVERILEWRIPLLDNYLDPLLYMPMLLHFLLWEKRLLLSKDLRYHMPVALGGGYLVLSIVCWEIIIPMYDRRFVADLLDAVCYAIGTLVFFRWGNK